MNYRFPNIVAMPFTVDFMLTQKKLCWLLSLSLSLWFKSIWKKNLFSPSLDWIFELNRVKLNSQFYVLKKNLCWLLSRFSSIEWFQFFFYKFRALLPANNWLPIYDQTFIVSSNNVGNQWSPTLPRWTNKENAATWASINEKNVGEMSNQLRLNATMAAIFTVCLSVSLLEH